MRRRSCSNQSACRLLSRPATCTLSQRIWSFRSASRDSGSPSAGRSARWSLTIPARVRRSRSLAVTGAVIKSPYPRYSGCGGLGIGRTPDGSDGAGLPTLAVDGKYLLEDSDAPDDPRGLPQVAVDQVAVQVHRHAGHGPRPKGQAGDWNAMASLSPTSPMASPPRPGGSHETSR